MRSSLGPAFFRDDLRRLWAEHQALQDLEDEQARERDRLKILWAIRHGDPEKTKALLFADPGKDPQAGVSDLARFQMALFEDPDWHDAETPLRLHEE